MKNITFLIVLVLITACATGNGVNPNVERKSNPKYQTK